MFCWDIVFFFNFINRIITYIYLSVVAFVVVADEIIV